MWWLERRSTGMFFFYHKANNFSLVQACCHAFSRHLGSFQGPHWRCSCINTWYINFCQCKNRLERDSRRSHFQSWPFRVKERGGESGGIILQISGARRRQEERNNTWHRIERRSGMFLRRFRLPEKVKMDQVKARMEIAVLAVTIPKEDKR